MSAARFAIAGDHGCLDGHFPGAPIVPGVMLLAHVVDAVSAIHGGQVTGIARCKFLAALYPDNVCDIELGSPVDGRLSFACHHGNTTLVRGVLNWEAERG